MTNITRKVVTGLTTGALLLSTFSSIAYADTNLAITGNAQNSDNNVNVNSNHSTTTVQSNTAVVTNTVNNNTNTGGNKANDNIASNGNGGVTITSGGAVANTNINNALNSNAAVVANCGCNNGTTNVAVTGNGRNSDNTANLNNNNNVAAFQTNNAVVTNKVNNNQNTGNNHANDNLGGTNGGGVTITSGPAITNTTVNTAANQNFLTVGSATSGASAGTTNLLINDNLRDSTNAVNVNLNHDVLATQGNTAVVTNAVNNNQNSGDNNADDNLGAVSVATGYLIANSTVNNAVNFNAASVDCGCMTDVNAKIAGNGRDSGNTLNGNLGDNVSVFQGGGNKDQGAGNLAVLTNSLNGNQNSGNNAGNDNGGVLFSDPSITTGPGITNNTVNNAGNVNTIGPTISLPTGAQLSLSFDMNGFLSMFGL